MDEVKRRLVRIHSCRDASWKTIYAFIKFDSSLYSIFCMKERQISELFHLNEKSAARFYHDLHQTNFDQLYEQYQSENIELVILGDNDYPKLLTEIYDPPWILYVKGTQKLLQSECISVVGTRNPSKYGYAVMKKILPPLIEHNWTIVSGLAVGIDTLAHQMAIHNNGKTIAVLGSGFHSIYPSQNNILAEEISKNHLLISEFPPDRKPEKWHFPLRNRIISGLSKGTLIIEAKERSGSLITAEQALEQGREVFAVCGSIFEPTSQGTNRLIQQGAKLVVNADDIMEEF